MKDNYEIYKSLAERNNWKFSMEDDNRPYFMKDDKYAMPDEFTSEDDKLLLATIISEGSDEMVRLILNCWENGIEIAGPCSGISEFHERQPIRIHFGIITTKEIIIPLYEELERIMPDYYHLVRIENGKFRYDFNHVLREELSQEESNQIFRIINDNLNNILKLQNNKQYQKKGTNNS